MPHNAETFKSEKLPKYPHMRPKDVSIWDAYLDAHASDFLRCWYDVKIGEPIIPKIQVDEVTKQDWWDLSRWAIDVVAEDKNVYYVIEIKPNANAKALGQCLAYAKLLEEKWRTAKPMLPVVITDEINPITAKAAAYMGVELWTP
jgi:hypothetical protein